MTNDFAKIISEAIDAGATIEDVAQQLTDALNLVQEQQANPKDKLLDKLEAQVEEALSFYTLDNEDCIAGITLNVAEENPSWDADDIQVFMDTITRSVETTVTMINCFKEGGNVFQAMSKVLAKDLDEGLATTKAEKTPEARNRSDNEMIHDFLKRAGLV